MVDIQEPYRHMAVSGLHGPGSEAVEDRPAVQQSRKTVVGRLIGKGFPAFHEGVLKLHHAASHFNPRLELAGVEGLRKIVVGPGAEPGDNVLLRAPGGEHDDIGRPVISFFPDPPDYFGPVHSRHHPVEHGQSGAVGAFQHGKGGEPV